MQYLRNLHAAAPLCAELFERLYLLAGGWLGSLTFQ